MKSVNEIHHTRGTCEQNNSLPKTSDSATCRTGGQ